MKAKESKIIATETLESRARTKKDLALNEILRLIDTEAKKGYTQTTWTAKVPEYETYSLEKLGYTITSATVDLSTGPDWEEEVKFWQATSGGTPDPIRTISTISWDKPTNALVRFVKKYLGWLFIQSYEEWERGYNQFKRDIK